MSNFYCPSCGSLNLYTQQKGIATGLYCKDCNKWIKWLGKKDLEVFKQHEEETLALILKETEVKEEVNYGIQTLKDAINQQTRLNEVDNNAFNRGMLKGLEIALRIVEVK